MTNRQDYTEPTFTLTPAEEVALIKEHLKKMKRAVTLENATCVAAMLISQSPGEWTLTLEELPKLWAETVTN